MKKTILLLAMVASSGVGGRADLAPPAGTVAAEASATVGAVTSPPTETPDTFSNILPGDYVGPLSCKKCHEEKYALWSQHPHSRMNQLPNKASVMGDFSGATLKLNGASASFTTEHGDYFMTVERGGQRLRRYKVTRTVGSRFMQLYIGLEMEGPEPAGDAGYTTEHKLPFGYWFRMKRWLPTDFFDPMGPEVLGADGVPLLLGVDGVAVHPYVQNCMMCHNTYPYAYRIVGGTALSGFPDARVDVSMAPLSKALSPDINLEPTKESFQTLINRLQPEKHLVTLGISCESCHFGGREHAINKKDVRFVPTSPFIQVSAKKAERPVTSDRKNAATVMGICAQCHIADVARHPNGAATCNSRDALDMYEGACTSKIRCVDCHDPHTAGKPATVEFELKQAAVCVKCHTPYSDQKQMAAHTHHPASADVSCLDCHMPRYTQGIDEVVHTHRIAKPVETSMLAAGSANACNLCHLDKSVSWTLQELERRWGWKVESKPEWAAAYGGNLDAPVGPAWLHGGNSSMRLVATQAYARSSLGKENLGELLKNLNDPVAVNRVFALFAVEKVLARPLTAAEYNVTGAPAERAKQVELLTRSFKK